MHAGWRRRVSGETRRGREREDISEAEALEMAQPLPVKLTSWIVSPSALRKIV